MEFEVVFTISLFVVTIALLAFEVLDKAIVTIGSSLVLILSGILTYDQALNAIDFKTIFVLAGMMILIDVARSSGFFAWLSVNITTFTKGNPFLIFLIFSLFTAFFSMFFSNVTAILIMAPITIELLRSMGRDPKPYLFAEIFLSNIGGAGSLLGDPANIVIGSGANLSFNDFIINQFPPVLTSIALVIGSFYFIEWQNLKPISKDLEKMFLANIIIKKIKYKFLSERVSTGLMIKSIIILFVTILGYILQNKLNIALPVIALSGAFLLLIVSKKEIKVEKIFESIQWSTLFFLAGLFMVVHGLNESGVLDIVAQKIAASTNNFALLLIIIIWASGIISMIVDNTAFVTVMVPIILALQNHFQNQPQLNLMWWALSLGAVFGGNGTIIGTAANVVGTDIARKFGLNINFNSFLRYGLPFAFLPLSIASLYILIRFYYI